MVGTARRTESEAVRREQILTAARRVFREKGYGNTTVSDIVKEAGMAKGTLYLYYSSKKDVVVGLGQMLLGNVSRRMREAYAPGLLFEDKVRNVIHVAFEVGKQNADLCKLVHFGAESATRELEEIAANHPLHVEMLRMFREAADAGEMRGVDPEMVVRLVKCMILSCLQEAYVFGDGTDAKRLEETIVHVLVGGLARRS